MVCVAVGYFLGPYTPPKPEGSGGMGGMMGMGGIDEEQLMAMLAQQHGHAPRGAPGQPRPRLHAPPGPGSGDDEALYEQLLGRLLQSVNAALAQRNASAALEHCAKALALCDEAWGPRALHRYAFSCVAQAGLSAQ